MDPNTVRCPYRLEVRPDRQTGHLGIIRESTPNITTTKGYENFELLYTGINSNALNLTYREFSPDGFARVAFFQNVTYDAGTKSITFKKFKIAVDHASSDSITFTVISDGF
jgi:hypothetical protein